MLENIKIFITHYTPLKNRKKYITDIFLKENITNYIFYEKFNREEITSDLESQEFSYDVQAIRNRLSGFIPHNVIDQFINDKLNQSEKSLSLKHKYIYKEFLENCKEEYLLVFEDDIIFVNNFSNKLNFILNEAHNKFDILLIGGGVSIKLNETKNNLFTDDINKIHFQTLGAHPFGYGSDSYIMSRKTVNLAYHHMLSNKIMIPIDWELSYFAFNNKLKTYLLNPYLTYQGSASGEYESSVRERKSLYD